MSFQLCVDLWGRCNFNGLLVPEPLIDTKTSMNAPTKHSKIDTLDTVLIHLRITNHLFLHICRNDSHEIHETISWICLR